MTMIKKYGTGMIEITELNDGSIQIAMDEDGCKFLIEELKTLLDDKRYISEYPYDSGRGCGVLTLNSSGFFLVRKDFD